ncbi:hypothetical protein DH2020_007848 [Rehmannia glutinosa]|uniref:Uncharacterized protein n=1 Tax=Rehmannia glutinosa TaxID=99300 RepID=A0ABR0TZC4_REHGL
MVAHVSMEVAKTVLEVADVAWTAVEHCHHHHRDTTPSQPEIKERGDFDIETLRSENERLRLLLEKNLNLLQQISSSPTLLHNCPSDLHDRLLGAVNSESFLNELESLRKKSTCTFPFDEPSGADLEKAEVLINVDHEEPSWWVWVSEEMVPSNIEEKSEIDNENYVIVTEEHVVDGVATFMARCILANPKSLTLSPMELQKALMKTLGGMNKVEKMLNIWHAGKMFYTLATWGLALARKYCHYDNNRADSPEFTLFERKVKNNLNMAGLFFFLVNTSGTWKFSCQLFPFVPRSSYSETCYTWGPPLKQNGSKAVALMVLFVVSLFGDEPIHATE